jgi:hypothetical protein
MKFSASLFASPLFGQNISWTFCSQLTSTLNLGLKFCVQGYKPSVYASVHFKFEVSNTKFDGKLSRYEQQQSPPAAAALAVVAAALSCNN